MIPDLDRVAADDYLAGLADRPTEKLRDMRSECTDLENGVSYVRRMAQGRLDLVQAETKRRQAGGGGDAAGLVADLPGLLSGGDRAPASGRVTGDLDPPEEIVADLTRLLDAAAGSATLTRLTELDDADLDDVAGSVRDFEARLSDARRHLHTTVDAINDELAQRYRAGEKPAGV